MADQAISFARGAPSLDIIPVEGLRAAADRAFRKDPCGTFSYGKAAGYEPLRQWIADKHGVEIERVLVTNGSMQADAFLFDLLVAGGDRVIVEAPSYDRTLLSLQNHGAEIDAVKLESDGVDTEAVANLIATGKRPKLAHIIPNFQNPAGCTLSLEKRSKLLQLADQAGFTVFEDDPYVELRFEGQDLPTMLSLSENASVVYASSFSKTVCPGIRVGYLVGPEKLIREITALATNTYISPSMVSQAIVAEFCSSGAIDESINTVKAALHGRRDALVEALRQELPEAFFTEPEGGYFLWAELPGIDTAELASRCAGSVVFVKGSDFMLAGGENFLRLAYSGVTEDQIREGIKRLAQVVKQTPAAA